MVSQLPAYLQQRQSRTVTERAATGLGASMPPHISIQGNSFTLIDAAGNEQNEGGTIDVCIADGGDRTAYQQDWANARESLQEMREDVAEGADMVMVKPAMTYLDVVTRARAELDVPIAAYHVSGEYSMVHAAAQRGWIDGDAVALEQITAILPGAGSPTVMPLSGRDDAVAVHAVCQEAVFWETLEKLKAAGASAVLVLPIEKMM